MRSVSLPMVVWICKYMLACVNLFMPRGHATSSNTNRFACQQSCSSESPDVFSLVQTTRSQIECATACSRRDWCHRYTFNKDAPSSQECTLLPEDGSSCSPNPSSVSATITCVRLGHGEVNSSHSCDLINETVLTANNSKASVLVDYAYLRNLLIAGTELKVQVDIGVSKYVTSATNVTFGSGRSGSTCATLLDSTGAPNGSASILFVRELCVSPSTTTSSYDVLLTPPMTALVTFSWSVLRGKKSHIVNNAIVFSTGGNSSVLEEAVESGLEIKLLNKASYSVIRADVISQNKGKRDQIAAQTTIYENGQYKLVSHFTTQPSKILLLELPLGKGNSSGTEKSDVVWLSDPCWRLVYTTQSKSSTPLNDLKSAVDLGKGIRVRFTIDNLVILASPDFVGIDESGTVVVHILRVLSQKSFLGELVTSTGIINSDQSLWTNYYITSNGSVSVVDSSKVTSVSDKGIVYWYTELHNYSLIHASSSRNSTSLSRLVAEVLTGKNVRVKVYNGTSRYYYACHMMHIVDNDGDVKCQVHGQLGVQFFGAASMSNQGIQNGISTLSNVVGLSPKTGCFQTVVILANKGSIDYYVACLGPTNSSQVRSTQPNNLEWFVSE